jgi:hypothetical protein
LQRRPPVAVEPQRRVVGTVTTVAVGAMVVEAAVLKGAVEAEDVREPLFDAAGVLLTMGADGTGA